MGGVAVVTDSTSSLSASVAERAGVTVIPLQVVVEDLSRAEGDVDPAEVARALRSGNRVSTSRPAPEVFAAAYATLAAAGYAAVVSAHLSGAISGTVEAARRAAGAASLPVRVVDTRVVAMANGFAALAGARAAADGAGPEAVAEVIGRTAARSTTYFCVDDLGYLRRGGRIGAAAAAFGSALSVKPLLTVRDGEIRSQERVRTSARARTRLRELAAAALDRAAATGRRADVAVLHLGDADSAAPLVVELSAHAAAAAVQPAELSVVLAVHTGPGTLGVVVAPR